MKKTNNLNLNIAFVGNGKKLQFFELISKSIVKKNNKIKIYWICISREQYDYLLKKGYKSKYLLLLNWDIRKSNGYSVGEYKLNELIWGDRLLKYHYDDALVYLKKMQSIFYSFVLNNDIKFIFGETTWAHEILMHRICKDKFSKKCYYLHPQSIRIPNGRFTFLDNEFQNTIFPECEYIYSEKEIEGIKLPIKPEVPQRVAEVANEVFQTLTWQYRFKLIVDFLIFNRFKKEPDNSDSLQNLRFPNWLRRKLKLKLELNKIYYTKILKKKSIEDIIDKKFFFFTLHMQPEASVDVVGRYYEDQFQLILNIWRILPDGYYLVIKEHTNAVGNRGREFFKKCLSLKNVIIVNEWENSHDIIKMSEAIFTNSGTVALEGALFGKDVFVFSKIFFDKIKFCHKISLEDLKYSDNFHYLLQMVKERDKNKMSLIEYSKYILRSSFRGVIDPPNNSKLLYDKKNIEIISSGFVYFLNTVSFKNEN